MMKKKIDVEALFRTNVLCTITTESKKNVYHAIRQPFFSLAFDREIANTNTSVPKNDEKFRTTAPAVVLTRAVSVTHSTR